MYSALVICLAQSGGDADCSGCDATCTSAIVVGVVVVVVVVVVVIVVVPALMVPQVTPVVVCSAFDADAGAGAGSEMMAVCLL